MGLLGLFHRKKQTAVANKAPSAPIDIRKAFEANLKYISSTEKDVDGIKRQFVKSDTRFYLTIGKVDCPTGKIVVSDPLAYLPSNQYSPVLAIPVPAGEYPVELSVCRGNGIGLRMCTARLKLKETEAESYKLAEPTEESAAFRAKDGTVSGFPVDAGMISLCDEQVAKEYREFVDAWHKEHPGGNHYDDYFAAQFKESYERLPQYQRDGGDFIEWENPKTKNKLVMIASGFGDGFYQSYWGYDAANTVCELIVPLVNPDLFGL